MKKKLTQGEKNKLKVLKPKHQKLESELAEYMEKYIEPMEKKLWKRMYLLWPKRTYLFTM
jgi:hypothetical protein